MMARVKEWKTDSNVAVTQTYGHKEPETSQRGPAKEWWKASFSGGLIEMRRVEVKHRVDRRIHFLHRYSGS